MSLYIIRKDDETIGVAPGSPSGTLEWFHEHCPAYSMAHATTHEGYSIETVEDIDCHDVDPIIAAICKREGVTAEFIFIPFSLSRNATPAKNGKVWRSLNWRVSFSRHGKTQKDITPFLVTDYSQGVGHCPAAKLNLSHIAPASWRERHRKAAEDIEIETGKVSSVPRDRMAPRATSKPVPPPSIGEVMQSLAREADVLDYGGFEDWASSLGYDTDSRSAESIYRACIDTTTKLRAYLGANVLEELKLVASFN